jgi:hypothetical protein
VEVVELVASATSDVGVVVAGVVPGVVVPGSVPGTVVVGTASVVDVVFNFDAGGVCFFVLVALWVSA